MMIRRSNLKAKVDAFLAKNDSNPEEAVALLKGAVEIREWGQVIGGEQAFNKFIVTAMMRCSNDSGAFLKYLHTLKKAKEDTSEAVWEELSQNAVKALLDREHPITVTILKEFVECAVALWPVKSWVWTTASAVRNSAPALDELIRSRDIAEAGAAVTFLSGLHQRDDDLSKWREHFFRVLTKDDVLVDAMVDKLKALSAEDCDSESARVFVGLWTGLYRLMSLSLDVKTTNRFFLILEKTRASKLLNPAVACRLMRAYVKFTPSHNLNPPKRVRLLGNFMKSLDRSLAPRNEKELEERRLLSLEVFINVPRSEVACQDLREKHLEDWVRVIVRLPLDAALRSWRIGFRLEGDDEGEEHHYLTRPLDEAPPIADLIVLLNALTKYVRIGNVDDRLAYTSVLFEALNVLFEPVAQPEVIANCRKPLLVVTKFILNAFSVEKDAGHGTVVGKLAEYVIKLKPDLQGGEDKEFLSAASAAIEALESVGEDDSPVANELKEIMLSNEQPDPVSGTPAVNGSVSSSPRSAEDEETPTKQVFADVDAIQLIASDSEDHEDVEVVPVRGSSHGSEGSSNKRSVSDRSLHDEDSQDCVEIDIPTKKPKLETEHQEDAQSLCMSDIRVVNLDSSQEPFDYTENNGTSSVSDGPKEQKRSRGRASPGDLSLNLIEAALSRRNRVVDPVVIDLDSSEDAGAVSDEDDVQVIKAPVGESSSSVVNADGSEIEQPVAASIVEGSRRWRKQYEAKKREDENQGSRASAGSSSASGPATPPWKSRKQPAAAAAEMGNALSSVAFLPRNSEPTSRRPDSTTSPLAKTRTPNPTPTTVEDDDDDVIFHSEVKGTKSNREPGASLMRGIPESNVEIELSVIKCEEEKEDVEDLMKSPEREVIQSPLKMVNPSVASVEPVEPVVMSMASPAATTSADLSTVLKNVEKGHDQSKLDGKATATRNNDASISSQASEPTHMNHGSSVALDGKASNDVTKPVVRLLKSQIEARVEQGTPEKTLSEDDEIVFPELAGRKEPVIELARFMAPASWTDTFLDKLERMNVSTVGEFCSLKAVQLKALPIMGRTSKFLPTVRQKLEIWLEEKEEVLEKSPAAAVPQSSDVERMDTEETSVVVNKASHGVMSISRESPVMSLVADFSAKDESAQQEMCKKLVDSIDSAAEAFEVIRFLSRLQEAVAAKFSGGN